MDLIQNSDSREKLLIKQKNIHENSNVFISILTYVLFLNIAFSLLHKKKYR